MGQDCFHQQYHYLASLCDLFGMIKLPFQWLSDLQPGDKMVTFNHLVQVSLEEDELKSLTMISLFETYIHLCTASLTSSIIATTQLQSTYVLPSLTSTIAQKDKKLGYTLRWYPRCTKRSPNLHSLMARVDQSVYIACHRWKRSFFCQVVVSSKMVLYCRQAVFHFFKTDTTSLPFESQKREI